MEVVNVKAVYKPGTFCDKAMSGNAAGTLINLEPEIEIKSSAASISDCNVVVKFPRINSYGNGARVLTRAGYICKSYINGYEAAYETTARVKTGDVIAVHAPANNNCTSVVIGLREVSSNGNIISGSNRSQTITIPILGENGLLHQHYHAELYDTAYQKVMDEKNTGEPYDYKTLWTNAMTWRNNFFVQTVSSSGNVTMITIAAKMYIAQKAIVDLVRQTVAAGLDYRDITWYQAQYYIFNTLTPNDTVPELVDSDTAEAWLLENKKPAVDYYMENR